MPSRMRPKRTSLCSKAAARCYSCVCETFFRVISRRVICQAPAESSCISSRAAPARQHDSTTTPEGVPEGSTVVTRGGETRMSLGSDLFAVSTSAVMASVSMLLRGETTFMLKQRREKRASMARTQAV